MTTIARTTTTTAAPDARPIRVGDLRAIAAFASRAASAVRDAVATAIVRGQLGPVPDTEIGRRTGARI